MLPFPTRFVSPLPDALRRPLSTIVLLVIAGGLGWAASMADWPREQALVVAILAATVLLWVTEALPLFATAFISVASQLLLLGNPGGWSWLGFENRDGPAPEAFLAAATDPVLLLFFAGFVLARAATNTALDRRVAALILRPMADSPRRLLLGVIVTTAFFSLWMSNTATAALMFAILTPVLRQIPEREPFRKGLILAVPISANVAGMSTPIASPPNAIAISYLAREDAAISFVGWMLVAIPIVLVLLAATRWWLLRQYPPPDTAWHLEFPAAPMSPSAVWVVVVALLTFAAWITEPWHGVRASVAAVLPVTLLFASTTVTRDDVNSLDWDVLILIAGGLALGYSLQITALDARLVALLPADAGDVIRLVVLGAATLSLGTFFSNTAIASMLMPVAILGAGIGTSQLELASYALTVAFVASLSMALPVSTPPNAMAYASGELKTIDFARTAGVIGVAGMLLVIGVLTWVVPLTSR